MRKERVKVVKATGVIGLQMAETTAVTKRVIRERVSDVIVKITEVLICSSHAQGLALHRAFRAIALLLL